MTDISSVVDKPDIPGNKLLKVDENQGPGQEVWRMNWNADPTAGATLVLRGVDLDAATYDRGFDVYIQNGLVRERFVSKSGNRIALNKSGLEVSLNITEWHIYRITIIGDYIKVLEFRVSGGSEPPQKLIYRNI